MVEAVDPEAVLWRLRRPPAEQVLLLFFWHFSCPECLQDDESKDSGDDGDANEDAFEHPITLGDVPLMETALASCTTPFKIKVKYQMDCQPPRATVNTGDLLRLLTRFDWGTGARQLTKLTTW